MTGNRWPDDRAPTWGVTWGVFFPLAPIGYEMQNFEYKYTQSGVSRTTAPDDRVTGTHTGTRTGTHTPKAKKSDQARPNPRGGG